jgi:hypothetical protein
MAHAVRRMLGTMGRRPTRVTQAGVTAIGRLLTVGQGLAERVPPSKSCQYNSKRGKDKRRLIRLH